MHLLTPSYDPANPASVCSAHFLVIHPVINHKSQTQLSIWQTIFHDYYTLYNVSYFGLESLADSDKFPTKVMGMMTDHTPDQYSLRDGFVDW